MCSGYYDHTMGYTPEWSGMGEFKGQWVHPQHWPQDLDCTGKQVVVIGSGATAATLIPSLADTVAHVTMLQRSPTFFAADSPIHPLETQLRELDVRPDWVHEIMRRAFVAKVDSEVRMSFEHPEEMRAWILEQARALLPEGFDVDKHFNPSYRPWQQRIALVPDGDLFAAIRCGKASVVTDGIERFDATGIQLTSGAHLDADIARACVGGIAVHLNDVAWSHTTRLFRRISGLLDPRVGRGPFNSYNAHHWFVRWPLDHIFHSSHFTLSEIRRLPAYGSDHFAMLIALRHTPAAAPVQDGLEADGEDHAEARERISDQGVHDSAVPEPRS